MCVLAVSYKLLGVIKSMIDRRGHRKLRLTSRKHFKPKPKIKQPTLDGISVEARPKEPEPTCLKVSLPVEAYINSPVDSITKLQDRLLRYAGGIPSGMDKQLYKAKKISVDFLCSYYHRNLPVHFLTMKIPFFVHLYCDIWFYRMDMWHPGKGTSYLQAWSLQYRATSYIVIDNMWRSLLVCVISEPEGWPRIL